MNNSDKPAMPIGEIHAHTDSSDTDYAGLTKREYFAAIALQGILANQKYEAPRRNKFEGMGKDAVMAADELLAALKNKLIRKEHV